MSRTLVQARRSALAFVSPHLVVVCLFSLLGLTRAVVMLACVSPDTIRVMLASLG